MAQIKVGFQNCTNLFPAGVVQRGPQSPAAVRAKVEALGDEMTANLGIPHLLGLCEVYDEPLARELLKRMGLGAYKIEFRPAAVANETGIAVCFDPSVLSPVPGQVVADLDLRPASRRPRWLAVAFEVLTGNRGGFWFVANHWKSQMGGPLQTDPDRQESAYLLGEFFMNRAHKLTEAMLLMGDFNCEPGDRPLTTQSQRLTPLKSKPNMLKSVRERALVLRDRNKLAYFYNCMWSLMDEPDTLAAAASPGYVPSRPMGTHGAAISQPGSPGWLMFDHVMASKRMLHGGPMAIDETTVKIHPPKYGSADHAAISVMIDC